MSAFFIRAALVVVALAASGCQWMYDQWKIEPYEASDFFADGLASRPPVPGTIARGHLRTDELFYTGKIDGSEASVFPFPVTRELVERGRERYDIYCSPCHDRTGSGHGMVVRRGFRAPPTFHQDRLRAMPAGHFFDVITEGFGAMYSYKTRITPRDRWAIVAYVRALQLSQNAVLEDVPESERAKLAKGEEP
jgi:hypothetical protein